MEHIHGNYVTLLFFINNFALMVVVIIKKENESDDGDVYITVPKRLIDELVYYFDTTYGLYATDLMDEANKMDENVFWQLKDEKLLETVDEIEKYLH
ncbi:MAG: hypothetical protein BZ138_07265 [Methanosphaera sp. rholeuAM270]|nr:MAG: hypothetical protein BZ138_07265 [Methanosphaera sp. rholeuAM270]